MYSPSQTFAGLKIFLKILKNIVKYDCFKGMNKDVESIMRVVLYGETDEPVVEPQETEFTDEEMALK